MLPDDLRQRAFAEAQRLGISFGAFVREAMHAALNPARRKGLRTDSLLSDRAAYRGGVPADYSASHDDYLYGGKP